MGGDRGVEDEVTLWVARVVRVRAEAGEHVGVDTCGQQMTGDLPGVVCDGLQGWPQVNRDLPVPVYARDLLVCVQGQAVHHRGRSRHEAHAGVRLPHDQVCSEMRAALDALVLRVHGVSLRLSLSCYWSVGGCWVAAEDLGRAVYS